MPFAGYICNARASGAGAPAPPAGALAASPADFAALDKALREMRAAGVRRLIVDGGDGTVREVISRAVEIWGPDPPPEYAILPHGNTNLIARHAGGSSDPAQVAELAREGATVTTRQLSLIRVERVGERTLRGFIMGAGAYETVTRFAQNNIGAKHGPQIAIAVLRMLASRQLRAGSEIGFQPGDGAPERKMRLLVALTTLPGPLIYRLKPFFGRGDGALRWLDVDADPPFLPLAAACIAAGAPMGWMRDAYRAGMTDDASISLDRDFVLDGELFSPGVDGALRVSANEIACFASL